MNKIKEVLRLKYLNRLSNRQIAKLSGISKSGVTNYCRHFEKSGLSIEEAMQLDDQTLQAHLYPEQIIPQLSSARPHPDWNYVHSELKKKGITRLLLWQEYKEQHPDGYGYTQFKEHYNRFKNTVNPSMRQIHYAGDKLFVDFSGLTMPIVNAKTGQIDKAQIFVAVLGASGYTFVHAVMSQSTEDFIECHTQAFHFLNGVPNMVVPDNLKAAVIYNKRGKIKLNESYADMGRHYGCAIEPARPYHPQDKSKVELGVKGIQRWILAKLRNHTFFDVNELNSAVSDLIDQYNNKIIKRLNKSRLELFLELDKPALAPMPANRYVYKEYKQCNVGIDYHIELFGSGYSVPYSYKSKRVDVWYSGTSITVSYHGKVIASHPRLYQPYHDSTLLEHMPLTHQYQYEKWNPGRILSWAASVGENALALVKKIMEKRNHPVRGYKSCIAILSLGKHYGNEALERACSKALQINTNSVSSIESILKLKTYQDDERKPANNLFNNHSNIRGREYFQ